MEAFPPPVAPDEMRSLTKRLPRLAPSLAIAGAAFFGTLGSYAVPWPPLAAPLLALSLTVLSIVLHDCAHGTLFPSRAANTAVGFLAGLFVWTPFFSYRHGHDAHHMWVGGTAGRDPTASPRREARPNRWLDFLLLIRIFPVFYWAGVFFPYLLYDFRRPWRASSLAQTAVNLLAIFALHGILAFHLGWIRYGALAALGFLGWSILYERLFTLNQHIGLASVDRERHAPAEQVNFSRSMRLPLSWLFLHFNLHKEHHLFPHLNYQLLPEIHRALRSRRPDLYAFTEEEIGVLRLRRRRSHELLTPTAGDPR